MDAMATSPRCWVCTLVSEAERLAYADRNKYVADTTSCAARWQHGRAAAKDYLRGRANLIRFDKSMGTATPACSRASCRWASAMPRARHHPHDDRGMRPATWWW